MSWASVIGHERAQHELRRAFELGRLPHALLFAGPEGIGKQLFATTFAQALLCERPPAGALQMCDACPACVQVKAGTHPDLLRIARPPDKHELPISVIRGLCADLGLKPMRGGRRVAIVDDADDLNEEAANAFLKTLEEPPPGSVLILIGSSPELQLDTVLSRCRVLRFEPLNEADLTRVLLERAIVDDPRAAQRLATLGEGSVKRALGLASESLSLFRRALIDELAHDGGFDPQGLASKLESFAKEAGKESILQRERASLLLGELARFFRGVLWHAAGADTPLPDELDRAAATRLAARLEPEDVFLLADRCLAADYQVQRRAYMPVIWLALCTDLDRIMR
jgi:DNA polymerase-3 subunit delta'